MIHLAITFDQNYIRQFYALACSVFENNKNEQIFFHVIATGLSASQRISIEDYIKSKKSEINFYNVDEEFTKQFVITNGNYTNAVYYRLFFPFLIEDSVEKLLYIDTDTIVANSLLALYNTDLKNFPVAAVYDNYVKNNLDLGIIEENNYFNSGVMLIDLPKWRALKISENAIEFLQKYPEKITFVDQDALNAVLYNNWLQLDYKFNTMFSYLPSGASMKTMKEFVKDKVIIHYTLQRPWFMICRNRLRYMYEYYLKLSPSPNKKVWVDFSVNKLGIYLKMRLMEFYFDTTFLQSFWKSIK